MFKKIEIWVLYLTIFLGLIFAFFFGTLVRQELVGSIKLGPISKTALFIAEMPMNLKALIFKKDLVLVDKTPDLAGFQGTPNDFESYMLLSQFDGDIMQGLVHLVDLQNFEILHTWNPDLDQFNNLIKDTSEFPKIKIDNHDNRARLLYPQLLSDGGLVVKYGHTPLAKLSIDSELIFFNQQDEFHHSTEVDSEDNIWTPSIMYPSVLPEKKIGNKHRSLQGYYDDAIVKLSPNGDVLYEKSVTEIFIDNGLEYLIFGMDPDTFNDPIHLNDIQPVEFDGPYWKKGDVFLSLRNQSMVLLYRPDTNQIIWKGSGPFFHQHDVNILDQKRISIFNNNHKSYLFGNKMVEGYSEVIIYNFETDEYSSYLKDSFIEHKIKTRTQGSSKILNNGDLFIEETNHARTLYFNKNGELRWTFVNRAKNGNLYPVAWSQILYTDQDIKKVQKVLSLKERK